MGARVEVRSSCLNSSVSSSSEAVAKISVNNPTIAKLKQVVLVANPLEYKAAFSTATQELCLSLHFLLMQSKAWPEGTLGALPGLFRACAHPTVSAWPSRVSGLCRAASGVSMTKSVFILAPILMWCDSVVPD